MSDSCSACASVGCQQFLHNLKVEIAIALAMVRQDHVYEILNGGTHDRVVADMLGKSKEHLLTAYSWISYLERNQVARCSLPNSLDKETLQSIAQALTSIEEHVSYVTVIDTGVSVPQETKESVRPIMKFFFEEHRSRSSYFSLVLGVVNGIRENLERDTSRAHEILSPFTQTPRDAMLPDYTEMVMKFDAMQTCIKVLEILVGADDRS